MPLCGLRPRRVNAVHKDCRPSPRFPLGSRPRRASLTVAGADAPAASLSCEFNAVDSRLIRIRSADDASNLAAGCTRSGVSKVLLRQWFFRRRKPEVSNGNYDLALVMLSDSIKVHFGGGNAK